MRHPLLPLIAAAMLTFGLGLGRTALTDADEAFYAEAGREMLETGDWLTPHFNYTTRFEKPVLYYWLVATAYSVAGIDAGTARLPSAAAGVALVLLTYGCGRRWLGHRAAWLAAAMVATSFGYFAVARMALPDLPLAAFVCLAVWATFEAVGRSPRREDPGTPREARRGWLLVAAASMALGFLVKGPVAVVLVLVAVTPALWCERDRSAGGRTSLASLTERWLRVTPVDLGLAGLVFAGLAVPWYAEMGRVHGLEYLHRFFVGENLDRFATARYNDPRGPWFYLPVLAGGFLPWTPLLLAGVPALVAAARTRRLSEVTRRYAAWLLLPLAFYSVSIGKQPRYVLPVLPPLALLLASGLDEWLDKPFDAAGRYLRVGFLASGAMSIAMAVLLYRTGLALTEAVPSALSTIDLAAAFAALGGALVIVLAGRRRLLRAFVVQAGMSVGMFTSLGYTVLATTPVEPVVQVAALLSSLRHDEAIGTHRVLVRNLVFYAKTPTMDLASVEQVHDFLTRPNRVFCVLPASARAAVEATLARPVVLHGEFPYVNAAGLRVGSLLAPDPERDISRIAVVSNY